MMTEKRQNPTDSEICNIRIMFPIESDEQAIAYKKQIREILSDVEDVQIQFAIMTAPSRPPMG